jgi:hypothetical protein
VGTPLPYSYGHGDFLCRAVIDRAIHTRHSRIMFTRRDRSMFTRHDRSMFTTHSRPVFTTHSRPSLREPVLPRSPASPSPLWLNLFSTSKKNIPIHTPPLLKSGFFGYNGYTSLIREQLNPLPLPVFESLRVSQSVQSVDLLLSRHNPLSALPLRSFRLRGKSFSLAIFLDRPCLSVPFVVKSFLFVVLSFSFVVTSFLPVVKSFLSL